MAAERTRGSRKFGGGHTTITCDFRQPNGDGCPDSTPRKGDSAGGVRKVARELGWSYVNGKDYCPVHTLEIKAQRKNRAAGICETNIACEAEYHYAICPWWDGFKKGSE